MTSVEMDDSWEKLNICFVHLFSYHPHTAKGAPSHYQNAPDNGQKTSDNDRGPHLDPTV